MPATTVFLCSTPEELDAHQAIAYDVAGELGLRPVLRDPAARLGRDAMAACERQIAGADLVLAIVGWRRGPVPPPLLGGDGLRPWLHFELRAAFRAGKPVAALLADDSFEPEQREQEARARSVIADLRGELAGIATSFGGDRLEIFEALLRQRLETVREASASQLTLGGVTAGLRKWPAPPLPDHPYPLLLPYHHPRLLAGRDPQVDQLIRLLDSPVAITGLHAPSGTSKSSLLAAGLVPRLRAAGRAVAFDRHPGEPGLVGRLIADLLVFGDGEPRADDTELFRLHLGLAASLAGSPPILVVDQVEDLFQPEARPLRARLGLALATSMQRQSSLEGPRLRWLLAYRREFHGPLVRWLEDVLAEARAEALAGTSDLPHDLSSGERFQEWALDPLGAPAPGAADPLAEATAIFAAAIEKPLAIEREDGSPRYAFYFAGDGARRLAAAFAASRLAEPRAPLAPELQVVLAHLLERASPASAGKVAIEVPEDPGRLLNQALEEHLRRALEAAFPGHSREARIGRTRALLALRELADVQGRRAQGLSADLLGRAIGQGGKKILEKLATSETRLVIPEEHPQGGRYVLAHDRLAEVLVRVTDEQAADLGFDHELIALRRVVTLEAALFEAGEPSSSPLPEGQYRAIAANASALLWSPGQESWWQFCVDQVGRERRRRRWLKAAAAGVLVLVAALAGYNSLRRSQHLARLGLIDHGEPRKALAALVELSEGSASERAQGLAALRRRPQPPDVVERGLEDWPPAERGAIALRVVELLLPEAAAGDPWWIASLAWALDFWALPDPALAARAAALREELLAPLRRQRPPPPADSFSRAAIPGGSFLMGTDPGQGRDSPELDNERPLHRVSLAPFLMLDHETTIGEYRLFDPDFGSREAADRQLPATGIDWYRAYTYAAWIGGRLPSEAEWEYAAQAACPCGLAGWPEQLDRTAWWIGNALDPHSGELILHPVKTRAPNPWGVYDLFGNAWEWTADWSGPYAAGPQQNPPGPAANPTRARIFRSTQPWPTYRAWSPADSPTGLMGFRVVWPAAPPPATRPAVP